MGALACCQWFVMKRVFLLGLILLLTGCTGDVDLEEMEKNSAEEILKIGKTKMTQKDYSEAAKIFEQLEKFHPYSKLTANAQLLAGDCYYKKGKYNEASSSYEIFVKTHPIHEKVPYALYMLGLINFEQMPIIERDQEATVMALSYFEEICNRYPETTYAKEAKKKIKTLRNQIAGREVFVARYYQKRVNYAAAVGRLNSVIDNYLDTVHAPEAMLRLIECYTAMGFKNEAITINKILQRSHGDSVWAGHARKILKTK